MLQNVTPGWPTASRGFDLEWLLHPVAVDHFFDTYWESQPLAIGKQAPDYFAELPGPSAVDELITATTSGLARSTDDGRLVRARGNGADQRGFRAAANGLPDVQDIYRAYNEGYSVVLNRLHRRSARVAALCRALEVDLHHPVGANMYLTPCNAQGFLPHVDTHDVFILQLDGVKEWHMASAIRDLPLAHTKQDRVELPSGSQRVTLRPGDVLYLPRGLPHEAMTSASSSLHLTVGVHVYRWVDLVTEALGILAEERLVLRQALPPGFLDMPLDRLRLADIAAEVASALTDGDVADGAKVRLGRKLLAEAKAAPAGHFRSLDGIQNLTGESVAMRAPGNLCRVRSTDGEARIEFATNYVAGPVLTEPALRFIAERERFTVDELPGALSTQDKLDLVSRLISEGLLYLP
jgi:bifunctional lysine-specific demethylase and histidyl-hydroxylase NO66